MRNLALSITLLIGLGCATAQAAPVNLVTNGSFETGLIGWTEGGANSGFPVAAIFYNNSGAYPFGAFGEAVPPNNAATNSPDAVGLRAAYFVGDNSVNHLLSQTITLAAGIYQIGFSAYAPQNGFGNQFNATFSGAFGSTVLASYAVSTGPAATWQTFAGSMNVLTAGNYTVQFLFNSFGTPAKDVVIDQVYVIAGNPPIGVPGPASLALFGIGLLGLAATRRRSA